MTTQLIDRAKSNPKVVEEQVLRAEGASSTPVIDLPCRQSFSIANLD
jgi:hypothetical protein